MYYVYELVNQMGTVEYVGHSNNPKNRLYQHIKCKPIYANGNGTFFRRQDLSLHIVSSHLTRTEAKREEMEIQKFWGFSTEIEKTVEKQRGQIRPKVWGEKNTNSKLTDNKVKEIKILISQGITLTEIGERFGIGQPAISRIKLGKTWKHVV
jgi:predicted GIY-YIG superfamily endonuclease